MKRSQVVSGLGFVAVGSVLLLDRGDVLDAGEVLSSWWPTLLILVGLTYLVMRPRQLGAGLFVLVMGGAFLAWTLGGIDTISLLWPLVLVAAGIALLVRRPRAAPEPTVATDDDLLALVDDRSVRAPSGPLRRRSITTIFGDLELDLSDAVVDRRTTLEVVTIFGAVELLIPEDWMVTTEGPQILGQVRIEPPRASGATRDGLHLELVAVFGNITVRRAAVVGP